MTEGLEVSEPAPRAMAPKAERQGPKASSRSHHRAETNRPFLNHVEQRTVVLPESRVLYLPVPKAGATTILWLLAELAGIPLEGFSRSATPDVSPAMTVHNMSVWGREHRLVGYSGEARERVLNEEGWFRFSVVRHPANRVWSAWQSKLLLREPRFLTMFGEESWFPRVPDRPQDLVDDFRAFLAAVTEGAADDVHWSVQHDLVEQLPLTHVGRVEALDETLALLRAHVGGHSWPPETRRENRTPLELPPAAYDETSAAALNEHYAADFHHYRYDLVEPPDDAARMVAWDEQVAPLLPLVRDTIEKHARIGQLHQTLEKRLEDVTARRIGHSKLATLTNLEGYSDFNVRRAWSEGRLESGLTAVVRVKNEAQALPWVLPALLRAVARVVIVDNASTDGTAEVALRVADEMDAGDQLEIHSYPFSVARCGEEHLNTPAASVHSLAYFYNWSFSHVRTRYALKWDGDMLLSDAAVQVLRDLAWQLEAAQMVVKIPRYPLYVADDRRAFLDVGLTNCEPWAWPNGPGYIFVKAMEWEQPQWPADLPTIVLPEWSCIELKHLDVDEFANWSGTDFDSTVRTRRKRREWEVFHALAAGDDPPAEVVPIEAPEGQHVIDYVRSAWLPAKANERPDLGERVLQQLTA